MDKTQSLERAHAYRPGILHAQARASGSPGRLRNLLVVLLLSLGLIFGGLALFLVNQSPASRNPTAVVPQLGVLYISSNVAFRNLPVNPAIQGLVITEVKPGSSASRAGLLSGDVLTHLDGKTIQAEDSLLALLKDYEVGDRLNLGVYRSDKSINITVVLT